MNVYVLIRIFNTMVAIYAFIFIVGFLLMYIFDPMPERESKQDRITRLTALDPATLRRQNCEHWVWRGGNGGYFCADTTIKLTEKGELVEYFNYTVYYPDGSAH